MAGTNYRSAMPQANNDGVVLEYDSFGDPADRTLLLIMGYTAQMTAWPVEFCEQLASSGHHVVRFDNRDCGLSSKTQGDPPNVMAIMMAIASGGAVPEVPYTLSAMADDAVAVLDAVGAEQGHIVGASMGGMITQQMAIDHPGRVATITSIMSTTGSPTAGQANPDAMTALLTPPPMDRDGAIQRSVDVGRIIGGPLFDEALAREAATAAFDRSFHPAGAAFQMAAIAKTGDRTEALQSVPHPALVIHGAADPLITPSGGEATAAALPNAELLVFDEMGHDLPRPLWDRIVGAIADHTAAA